MNQPDLSSVNAISGKAVAGTGHLGFVSIDNAEPNSCPEHFRDPSCHGLGERLHAGNTGIRYAQGAKHRQSENTDFED